MPKDPAENSPKFTDAYHAFVARVHTQLEQLDERNLEAAYEHAKETAIRLGELTREEAQTLLVYVKRDIDAATDFLQQSGEQLSAWLKFDVSLLEWHLWEQFSQVADQAQIDMLRLNQRLQRGPVYRSGEWAGMGTLQCDACGALLTFTRASEIPLCGTCGQTEFSRSPLTEKK